jgi:transcriptional regulator with XRE-family HTH domain
VPNYMEELKKRGLTLRSFADRVGISATHAAAIFKGKSAASAETEEKMRKLLCECPWCHRKWPEPVPEKKTA